MYKSCLNQTCSSQDRLNDPFFYNEGVNERPVSDGKSLPSLWISAFLEKVQVIASAYKKNMSHSKSLVFTLLLKMVSFQMDILRNLLLYIGRIFDRYN